ncbi:MAG: adenylate/guanylate cyclase domain-containing protein [Dehalococcoidia bacterium]
MEPQIQYTNTSDGVSIAYWTMGKGPPVMFLPGLPLAANADWELFGIRELVDRMASKHRFITFDRRNTGLSQRGVEDVSIAARLQDIDAVANRLELERFDVIASGTSAVPIFHFVEAHPARIRRLVLVDAVFRLPGFEPTAALLALTSVLEYDWESYTEMVAGLIWGWTDERRHRYAVQLRAASTWDDFRRGTILTTAGPELPELLERITAPTLVIHHRDAIATNIDMGRRTAAAIPNARFVALEGRAIGGGLSDPRALAAVEAFLAEDASAGPEREHPSGTAIILFADIADSTALTERLGDAAFREKARALDESLRRAIESNGGTAIEGKLLGDGVLATFGAAREAIACAAAMHEAARAVDLALHVGIHAGDVIRENDNVYGGAVNIASRVASEAAAGGTLVSGTVRDLARTSASVSFEDRGERELKGVGEPVRLFAVRWQEAES